MSNQKESQIEYALAVIASLAPINGVSDLALAVGDKIVTGTIDTPPEGLTLEQMEEAFGFASILVGELGDTEVALLASPLGGAVAKGMVERFIKQDLAGRSIFKLGAAYVVREIREDEVRDILIEDAVGNQEWTFSGLLGIKNTLINGVGAEKIYEARKAPRH